MRAASANPTKILAYFFFLLVSDFIFEVSADIFIFEVSVDILLEVSVLIVVVSGFTAVVSSVDFDSLLLLQAAKEAAIIAIAKNFFILRF